MPVNRAAKTRYVTFLNREVHCSLLLTALLRYLRVMDPTRIGNTNPEV